MLSHHATTRQQRYQNLVNDAVLERKEKKTGKENLPENNPGRCMHSENIHKKINKKNTYKLSQIQVSAAIHEHVYTHCFMYSISTALTNNKLHKIFSKISNMCSFPFCTCTSAKKKNCWERAMGRRGGGGKRVNEGKGRASSRRDRVSEQETDCVRERENTQLTLLQATPLSNSPSSACIPLAGSQSHVWLLSQLQAFLQLCILDFIFTMATQPWP